MSNTPICGAPSNSGWLLSYVQNPKNSHASPLQKNTTHSRPMNHIVLVGFLPCDNGRSCKLHPFGCGNSLVLNREDGGVGMRLRLRMTAPHELACYTINGDGMDGCRVCFVAREVVDGVNAAQLNGAVVCVVDVFTSDHENRAIRRLFHHNRGYAYGNIVMDD